MTDGPYSDIEEHRARWRGWRLLRAGVAAERTTIRAHSSANDEYHTLPISQVRENLFNRITGSLDTLAEKRNRITAEGPIINARFRPRTPPPVELFRYSRG
ncbi:MAG: hypothetical protein AAB573_02720 [Patescibacteria group bacterium]